MMNQEVNWLHLFRKLTFPYLLVLLVFGSLGLLVNSKIKNFRYKDIETKEHYNLMLKKRELEKLVPSIVEDLYYTSLKFSQYDIRTQLRKKTLAPELLSTFQWPLKSSYEKLLITDSNLLPLLSLDSNGTHFHQSRIQVSDAWVKELAPKEIGTNLSRPTDVLKELFFVKSFKDKNQKMFYLFLYFPATVLYEYGNKVLSPLRPKLALARETDHEVVFNISQASALPAYISSLRSKIKDDKGVRDFYQGINLTEGGSFYYNGDIIILEKTNLVPTALLDEYNTATFNLDDTSLVINTEPYYFYAAIFEKDILLRFDRTTKRISLVTSIAIFMTMLLLTLGAYLSEKKKLTLDTEQESEGELKQKAKLLEQKEILSSFIHEISNPLSVISTLSNQITKNVNSKSPSRDKVRDHSSKISEMARRVKTHIEQLRKSGITKIEDPVQKSNIRIMLEAAMEISSSHLAQADCDLELHIANDLPDVECRMTQLVQVFSILIINSCEAISTLKERWIKIDIFEKDNFLHFEFRDSGPGISSELRNLVMDAFYSTKPNAKSGGLGLAIAKRIVLEHDGHINILHEENNTCFEITLPKISHKVKTAA